MKGSVGDPQAKGYKLADRYESHPCANALEAAFARKCRFRELGRVGRRA